MSEPTDTGPSPDTGSTNDDLHGAAAEVEEAMQGEGGDPEEPAPTPGNG